MINVWLRSGCLLFLILALAGCGATQFNSQLPDSFALKADQTMEFPPVENVTGKTLEIPADQIFNEYMANLLKERNLLHLSSEPAPLVLKTKLIEYEPGSAFGRWLLPGLGTTVCAVHAEVLDKKSGALVGRLESRQTVSFGGAYSIGADTYICKRVADALIDDIDTKLGKKPKPESAE